MTHADPRSEKVDDTLAYSNLSESSSLYEPATHETKWTRFAGSFRRAESPQMSDCKNLTSLEMAVRKTAQTSLQGTISPISQAFIALGGCVGSGLLIVSGVALADGGPAGILIGWAIVSTYLYCVMEALAELSSAFPISGAFAAFATRFIDPSFGFAAGWIYALFWVVVLPLELVAASLTIDFWQLSINSVIWVAVFYVLIIVLNLFGTSGFEYFEIFSSIIKLIGIVGFNILAIVLICGGGERATSA